MSTNNLMYDTETTVNTGGRSEDFQLSTKLQLARLRIRITTTFGLRRLIWSGFLSGLLTLR